MNKERKTTKKSSTKSATTKKSVKKDVIVGNEIFDNIKPIRRKHFGFGFRVGFLSFLFCAFLFASIFLIITAITFENAVYTNYSERSTLDYKVNLKPNNYYETDVLTKNMNVTAYIASLIDSIDAVYNYNFDIDNNIKMDFTYDVIAKLSITDEHEENVYLEKEYTLLSDKIAKLDNDKHLSINETVKIDYNYYNNIANGFKAAYGVNSKSNLLVMLRIRKSNDNETTTILNGNSVQQLKIPLSERAINIKLDYTDLNNNSLVISEENVNINNTIKLVAGVVCLLFALYNALKVVRLFEKSSIKANKFDKYVNKILRTYDRLIVESRNKINLEDYQIIKVNKFEELLDVRDNLKLPINYYVVTPHQKAEFYIISTNVYMYTVKEVDLENQ